ncbi:hypothetical protein ACFL3Q_06790 [Planctomycetota bacterium]
MNIVSKGSFAGTLFVTLAITFVASPVLAIPPDPNNAALLYYQGFLSLPQLSQEERVHIGEVARGKIVPDDQVRQNIDKSTGAIHFTEAAVKVSVCNWGVEYSQGFEALMPQMPLVRFMTFVLVADARVRAADGDYRGALERCLMTETFARHIGDDTMISYLVTISVRAMAYKCMQEIAAQAADDTELLQWLKNKLATSSINTLSPVRPLKIEIEIVNDLMRIDNVEKFAWILAVSNEKKAMEIVKRADEKTLEQARQIYSEHMNSALTVLSTPMPYEQAHSRLEQLADGFDKNDPVSKTAGAFMPALGKIFSQKTFVETKANAIMVGIEILLDRARTGQLPDALPSGLPKDVFSGKDFEYEKTKEGFVLRCRDKDLGKKELYQYQFNLSK